MDGNAFPSCCVKPETLFPGPPRCERSRKQRFLFRFVLNERRYGVSSALSFETKLEMSYPVSFCSKRKRIRRIQFRFILIGGFVSRIRLLQVSNGAGYAVSCFVSVEKKGLQAVSAPSVCQRTKNTETRRGRDSSVSPCGEVMGCGIGPGKQTARPCRGSIRREVNVPCRCAGSRTPGRCAGPRRHS